jgi:hypothetical protein
MDFGLSTGLAFDKQYPRPFGFEEEGVDDIVLLLTPTFSNEGDVGECSDAIFTTDNCDIKLCSDQTTPVKLSALRCARKC